MGVLELLLVTGAVLGSAGGILLRQSQYLDGDGDAFWRRNAVSSLVHSPRHPLAIRARRRGWVLLLAGTGSIVAGFVVRALAR
jgi:hypothetical protein